MLLRIDRKRDVGAGKLFAIYVAGYTFIRFFIEQMRVDFASKILGLRVNEWVSGIVFFIALAYLLTHRHQKWVAPEPTVVDPEGEGLLPAEGIEDGLPAEEVETPDLVLNEGDPLVD